MRVLDPKSLIAYRYRVRMLSREVCEQADPRIRVNIAQQLANAATELAVLEAQELARLTPTEPA
ncbi:hypothetical protein H6F90_21475 [Trichocoleus sp. FACHB-591]|uniref:hypothetical protein n=1 Tax=Trichocoleus sp. FACHB-591 TaxID=2692872 RepID=UPI001688C811|nr:hypothetical protein [Trichocoleus sp. FACHB-591]MBD2097673.1 hypothetical protein [Trichocoleus sp. FACHB-591]